MKYLAVLIGLLIQVNAFACSFIPEPFCRTLSIRAGQLVVSGEIVGVDTLGIDLKIIDVLRGSESREIIRIWDGTDFDCNGIWSMAAADIGVLSDTVLIILPQIVEIENDWDVIGDFRRPHPYTGTPELKVEDNVVKGFINGIANSPPQFNLWNFEYAVFVERIMASGDCSSIVSTKEPLTLSSIRINNPFSDNLRIQLEEAPTEGSLTLFSLSGAVVFREELRGQRQVEVAATDLGAGVYVLEIRARNKIPVVRKVLKL